MEKVGELSRNIGISSNRDIFEPMCVKGRHKLGRREHRLEDKLK
jgi:hypothetical protein